MAAAGEATGAAARDVAFVRRSHRQVRFVGRPEVRNADVRVLFGEWLHLQDEDRRLETLREQMRVPAFTIWEPLPGFDRLQVAMKLVEHTRTRIGVAFHPKGMSIFSAENWPPG